MTAWAGGVFGDRARCVLAPNPGIMTLDGTNTWVLREPGGRRSVVVDPGPLDEGHLEGLAGHAFRGVGRRQGAGVDGIDDEFGAVAGGNPEGSGGVAPTARLETSQFHIIHPQVVK